MLTEVPYTIRVGNDCTTVSTGMAKFTPDEMPDPATHIDMRIRQFAGKLSLQYIFCTESGTLRTDALMVVLQASLFML